MSWTIQTEMGHDKCGQIIPQDETKMKVEKNVNYHFCMRNVLSNDLKEVVITNPFVYFPFSN